VEVLTLQVFVSLTLVLGSLLLFAFTCRKRTFDHADRLALLPLQSDCDLAVRHSCTAHQKDDDHEH
jgi:hypothetical protein